MPHHFVVRVEVGISKVLDQLHHGLKLVRVQLGLAALLLVVDYLPVVHRWSSIQGLLLLLLHDHVLVILLLKLREKIGGRLVNRLSSSLGSEVNIV